MRSEACLLILTTLAHARRGPHHPSGRHRHHRPSDVLTADTRLLRDTSHLQEDTRSLTPERLAAMSPEELEFHYFTAHDFDANAMLDGLELLKAVFHTMEHEHHDEAKEDQNGTEPERNNIEFYIDLVDKTLRQDDTDLDGYISYAEYRAARLRDPSAPRVLPATPPPPPRAVQT